MTKPIKAFTVTGGGARGIACAGVIKAGESKGIFSPWSYDVFAGDSFGSLISAMMASGWSGTKMSDFFCKTDFKGLLSGWIPWSIRKPFMAVSPVSLAKVAKLIDSLDFKRSDKLFINTWDAEDNKQVIYCQSVPTWAIQSACFPVEFAPDFGGLSLGTVLTRSMALPGLVADSLRWMDGGIGEHPPICLLPDDTDLTVINLGFPGLIPKAGDTTPKTLIDRGLYAVEVIQSTRQDLSKARFTKRKELNPKIYDIDSTDFGLSQQQRLDMIGRAYKATLDQW